MSPVNGETWTGRQILITQRLRQRRAELGLTQKQVVSRLGRAGVRTTNRAVSSLEHGTGVDIAKLPELAAALDCTVTYLVGLTDDPHCWEPDQPSARLFHPRRLAAEPRLTHAARDEQAEQTTHSSWILGPQVPDRDPRWTTGDTPVGR